MVTDSNTFWIVVAIIAVSLALIVALALARRDRNRTAVLKQRFGPEYDRTVHALGGRAAERELAARAKRVDEITFRELSDADRLRFTSIWTGIQQQFVDDPRAAVIRANELIKDVMRARGYSADDAFEQRAADLSVDHPDVIQHYRAARSLSQSGTHEGMNTEELRQAVVHYRVLFADLLQPARPMAGVLRPAHA